VRKEVTGAYQIFNQEPKVWETFRRRIHEYAKLGEDVTIIADAVNDTNSLRKYYANEASEFDKKIFVFIEKPVDVVLAQNHMRRQDKWVPEDVIMMFYKKVEQPSEEVISLYHEFIYIK